MARKCGICQKNTIRNNTSAMRSSVPVIAVQPITGGSAPGTAPISVFSVVVRFSGVYTNT